MGIKVWEVWCEQFAARPRRERAIVATAVVLGGGLIVSTLFVEPELGRVSALGKNVDAQKQEKERLDLRGQSLMQQVRQDPDAQIKAERRTLLEQLRQVEERLSKANHAMVSPQEMNPLLERVLARHPHVQLVSLRTLSPSSFMERKDKDEKAEEKGKDAAKLSPASKGVKNFDVFRHGVEITLTGTYADLHGYLAQLEREKQKVIWGEVRLKVTEYPKAELTLVIYTLSVDREWLAI